MGEEGCGLSVWDSEFSRWGEWVVKCRGSDVCGSAHNQKCEKGFTIISKLE